MTPVGPLDVLGVDLGGTKVLLLCGDAEDRSATGPEFSPAHLEGDSARS